MVAGCVPSAYIVCIIRRSFDDIHEKDRIPPRDPEADQLYLHARWLVRNNILKNDPAVYPKSGFNGPEPTNQLNYLSQQKDPERVRRYQVIGHILFAYSYLHPRVPELDSIVPLPPAKLPPWDGKLQWLEAHKANLPPPLPDEARIAEMARAKNLDPKTGRPLPPEAAKALKPHAEAPQEVRPGARFATGQIWPLTSLWVCATTGRIDVIDAGKPFPEIAWPVKRSWWQVLIGAPDRASAPTTWILTDNGTPVKG